MNKLITLISLISTINSAYYNLKRFPCPVQSSSYCLSLLLLSSHSHQIKASLSLSLYPPHLSPSLFCTSPTGPTPLSKLKRNLTLLYMFFFYYYSYYYEFHYFLLHH
ncbi:hypothetical protein ACOSP7_001935 [Xanthoceras sorbifolium]